ncbi:hypothetical protein [Streptomyces lavendulae]|uniref:hypothetical protein n=1 Tax=Streptomyces lavendulae TaxID=1914 RepID=UPI0024A47869|nr:hypothetical protein [Streptomyces lavendulae]GLX22628.1 hypothetical protein Slala01_62720 [Streptomyces lavendulae subsp. lavendulae]GLX30111.1 hypothetical protein Slala02_59310 [Streptomyces lavendulae subsp. lavendulae]
MHTLAAANPDHVVLAGDVLDWANTKTGQVRALVLTVAALMAIIAVLMAWWKTRSFVGTLVAFVLAALVLWGISNLSVLQTKVGSEINDTSASVSVVHVTGNTPAPAGEGWRVA